MMYHSATLHLSTKNPILTKVKVFKVSFSKFYQAGINSRNSSAHDTLKKTIITKQTLRTDAQVSLYDLTKFQVTAAERYAFTLFENQS